MNFQNLSGINFTESTQLSMFWPLSKYSIQLLLQNLDILAKLVVACPLTEFNDRITTDGREMKFQNLVG
jgi:hypothetical protein